MNKVQITLKGKVITLLFGTWLMGNLIKSGYALDKLKDAMTENPFEFLSRLLYLAAVNGTENKDLNEYNQNHFYDWIDEAGGMNSSEVVKVLNCFTNSLGVDVAKKNEVKQSVKSTKK